MKIQAIASRIDRVLVVVLCVLCMVPLSVAEDLLPVSPSAAAGSAMGSETVSLDIKNMDLADVFKMLAMKSAVNIVVGKDVKGKISIFLKDVNVWRALQTIIAAHNLAYEIDDQIVYIMTARDYEQRYGHPFLEKRIIGRITFVHARATDSMRSLTPFLSTIGTMIVDERANALIIMDVPERIEELRRIAEFLDQPAITRTFRVQYADVAELAPRLKEHLTASIGTLDMDERSRTIIVHDVPQVVEEIGAIIEIFDVKNREVLIEAKIIQVTINDEFRMGVNWEVILSKLDKLTIKSAFEATPALAHSGSIAIGDLEDPDLNYEAMIELLDSLGSTELLSSPRITVLNNEEAKIMVGTNQPFVTTTTVTPAAGGTTTSEQVTFIEVGVKLYVTPTIHPDGFVTMSIKPEVSSLGTPLTTAQGNQIPVVHTSEAETRITIKDGTTIIIAGLIKNETADEANEVPILGDIPFLGAVFRNKAHATEKTELVIFITPRIITGERSSDVDAAGYNNIKDQITASKK